jgi:hypothetical protein
MNVSFLKQPSVFLPLTMSLTALALVLGRAAIYGVIHEADEGAPAHIWQLLMAAQLPLIAFLAVKWLPQDPRPTLQVLGLLAGTTLANLAAVYFLT